MGIGTDTYPHNMLDEMRLVAYLARTQANDPRSMTTTELFDAATIGGAKALGRDDIGRLAAGCRADFVLVDITHPMMRPARDPVRSLIYAAGDRAVKDVFVDGRKVVEDGEVLTMDYRQAAEHLHEAQKRVAERARRRTGRIVPRWKSPPADLPLVVRLPACSRPFRVGGLAHHCEDPSSASRGCGRSSAAPSATSPRWTASTSRCRAAAPSASSARAAAASRCSRSPSCAWCRRPAASPPGACCSKGATCSTLSNAEMRDVRGSQVAMIFQEPMTSLNPVHTVGFQITEAMRAHDRRASEPPSCEPRDRGLPACASPRRTGASTNTRTSSRAACASA
jgi:ABC-type dipeptide/oligopeptide/nickel transport system ATPase component